MCTSSVPQDLNLCKFEMYWLKSTSLLIYMYKLQLLQGRRCVSQCHWVWGSTLYNSVLASLMTSGLFSADKAKGSTVCVCVCVCVVLLQAFFCGQSKGQHCVCNSIPASLITVGSFIADQGKGNTVPWLPVCWGATVSTQKKSHGRFVHSCAGGFVFVRMCGWMCKGSQGPHRCLQVLTNWICLVRPYKSLCLHHSPYKSI